jgi:transposase-like protein
MNGEQPTQERRVVTQYSAEDRERLIREQAKSGLCKKEFCAQHGINLGTFYGWGKLRKRGKSSKPKFVKVNVPAPRQSPIEVELSNGTHVRICAHGKREDLVALIRGIAGC